MKGLDNTVFRTVFSNIFHTRHPLFTPPRLHTHKGMSSHSHPLTIPQQGTFIQLNFIRRMLFI